MKDASMGKVSMHKIWTLHTIVSFYFSFKVVVEPTLYKNKILELAKTRYCCWKEAYNKG